MTTFTYPDLVRRLYDLAYLAEPPVAGERSGCFSSYDRASRYDPVTGQYLAWDANDDGSGFIRYEGDRIVALEAEGPGVLWRVWSALPQAGHIEIFIDDATTPVIDMPFDAFFERFNNDIPPLNFPNLVSTLSRGHNRFIPIPYNQYCKVRFAPGWGRYYHFTYSSFPQGTSLPRFDGRFDRAACLALAEADRLLGQRGWRPPLGAEDVVEQYRVDLPPGQTVEVCSIVGNRAIIALKANLDLPGQPNDREILRELTMHMYWDGEASPSVWSPLGDFFGTAPGVNYYRTLPLGMTDGGLYSHWYMPFAEQARILLSNDGAETRMVTLTVTHQPLRRPAQELLRFHAKWHRDAFLEEVQQRGRAIDWPVLLVQGRGRFCGMHLHVWNRWTNPPPTAASWWYGNWEDKTIDWWWGEGDEKFFVDGETFPSTFGTGSEDYIGYAWAAEPPFPMFDSPFASQPWVELDANGHTSVNRFQICDNVPFQTSFEGCIEKYKANRWGAGNVCYYAAIAYWYQEPGQPDRYPMAPLTERTGYYHEPDA